MLTIALSKKNIAIWKRQQQRPNLHIGSLSPNNGNATVPLVTKWVYTAPVSIHRLQVKTFLPAGSSISAKWPLVRCDQWPLNLNGGAVVGMTISEKEATRPSSSRRAWWLHTLAELRLYIGEPQTRFQPTCSARSRDGKNHCSAGRFRKGDTRSSYKFYVVWSFFPVCVWAHCCEDKKGESQLRSNGKKSWESNQQPISRYIFHHSAVRWVRRVFAQERTGRNKSRKTCFCHIRFGVKGEIEGVQIAVW